MLEVSPIAAFDDNYIWLLRNPDGRTAAVVDPGDEEPVLQRLEQEGLTLSSILITHKHGDHTGGVHELKVAYPDVVVYGPHNEPIRGLTRALGDGESLHLPDLQAEFTVMELPGHTEGHIAYYGEGMLFCGDVLFAAGCGRVFSGTHGQMYSSLRRIADLPGSTRIYCAHEYTMANLGFAKWVEPDNPDLLQREQRVKALRAEGRPSVPSTLEEELASNPFLRTGEPVVVEAAVRYAGKPLEEGAQIFTAIRTWKDREYD